MHSHKAFLSGMGCLRHCIPCATQQLHPLPHVPTHVGGGFSHGVSSLTHRLLSGQQRKPRGSAQRPSQLPASSLGVSCRFVLQSATAPPAACGSSSSASGAGGGASASSSSSGFSS